MSSTQTKNTPKSVATVAKSVEQPKPETTTEVPHVEKKTPTKIHLSIAEKAVVVSSGGGVVSFFPGQWLQDKGLISIAVANKISFRDVSNKTPKSVTFLRDEHILCGNGSTSLHASQHTSDPWIVNAACEGGASFIIHDSSTEAA